MTRKPTDLEHRRKHPAVVDALVVLASFVIFMWLWWVMFG
jgi:hypothetical protein